MMKRRMSMRDSKLSVVVAFLFCSILLLTLLRDTLVGATEVKWTGNSNDQGSNDPAITAPKSQKYWDEHNIERPDYAKTDAEIMAERVAASGGWLNFVFRILLFVIAPIAGLGYFVIYPRVLHGKGQTLSGRPGLFSPLFGVIFSSKPSDQAAREARLSRFGNYISSSDEKTQREKVE